MYKNTLEYFSYLLYKSLPEHFYPWFLEKIYKQKTGKKLNLKNPKTFTEKIQWLKLYDNIPLKTRLTDKLQARKWCQEKVNSLNYPYIYGVWNSFDEIDFDILPSNFFLKANHGCAMNIRVENKDNFLKKGKKQVSKIFDKWLKTNFAFVSGFELQYNGISPKIYAEEQLFEETKGRLSDYKVLCMNGKPVFIEYYKFTFFKDQIIDDKIIIYNTKWEKQNFGHTKNIYEGEIPKPHNFDSMLETAEILAKDFKFVRVDFYEVDKKLYFAELTFTPSSGFMIFNKSEYDLLLGNMLNIN